MKGSKKKNKINKNNSRLNKKGKRTKIKNNSKNKRKNINNENDLKKNKLRFFHPINISYFDTLINDFFPEYKLIIHSLYLIQ